MKWTKFICFSYFQFKIYSLHQVCDYHFPLFNSCTAKSLGQLHHLVLCTPVLFSKHVNNFRTVHYLWHTPVDSISRDHLWFITTHCIRTMQILQKMLPLPKGMNQGYLLGMNNEHRPSLPLRYHFSILIYWVIFIIKTLYKTTLYCTLV